MSPHYFEAMYNARIKDPLGCGEIDVFRIIMRLWKLNQRPTEKPAFYCTPRQNQLANLGQENIKIERQNLTHL